jgi:hypothetical protein
MTWWLIVEVVIVILDWSNSVSDTKRLEETDNE